ncbi:MAG: alpha/beta fold hydrolase [Cyclobacteriaceae bacterium]|nr:alpha/beta fold hydrolase [Cyclobacteriaceae bacterium]
MTKNKVYIASSQLEYIVFNKESSKYLLCFHGFGQSANDFEKLAKAYTDYKIVGVNLFFHEESYLRPKRLVHPKFLKEFLAQLIEKELPEKFSLMGYSMGGRFALTTLKLFPEKIDTIYLLAPDGLVEGNWFRFATGSYIQRTIFKGAFSSYPTFISVATRFSKVGILNKGLLKFAEIHLKNEEERNRVYDSWTNFRKLKLSPYEFHYLISKYKVKSSVVLGMYDKVIPAKRIVSKLIESPMLKIYHVPITHNKLFYYNFLDQKKNSSIN